MILLCVDSVSWMSNDVWQIAQVFTLTFACILFYLPSLAPCHYGTISMSSVLAFFIYRLHLAPEWRFTNNQSQTAVKKLTPLLQCYWRHLFVLLHYYNTYFLVAVVHSSDTTSLSFFNATPSVLSQVTAVLYVHPRWLCYVEKNNYRIQDECWNLRQTNTSGK